MFHAVFFFIASVEAEEAAALSDAYANASSVSIDVQHEQDKLDKLVGDHELVIRYAIS